MVPSIATTYSHKVLDEQWTIQYKVRASNSCGYTDSDVLTVLCQEATNKPGKMSPVTSTLGTNCNVQFTWYAPSDDGGESITSYKIEVQGAGASYFTISSCSSVPIRDTMSCSVNMSDLSGSPFFLQSGAPIMVVGRAYNANGWCDQRSNAQGSVEMMTTGLDAPHLRLEGVPREYITLAWTDIPSASSYEIEWDQGKDGLNWVKYRRGLELQYDTDDTQLPTMRIQYDFAPHGG